LRPPGSMRQNSLSGFGQKNRHAPDRLGIMDIVTRQTKKVPRTVNIKVHVPIVRVQLAATCCCTDWATSCTVFAAEAPAASVVGTTSPTRSPVVMINALGPEQAQPNTRFMAFAVLIVVYFLSLAVGFALYKRNQRRTLQVKEAVEPPPETALSPV
jgi:hypothetical protein